MEKLTENQIDLVKLLHYSGVEMELIIGIVAMMEEDKKLIQLVKWIDENPRQVKAKVLEKALEIYQTEVK